MFLLKTNSKRLRQCTGSRYSEKGQNVFLEEFEIPTRFRAIDLSVTAYFYIRYLRFDVGRF